MITPPPLLKTKRGTVQYLMNNEGTVGTNPVNDDTGLRTFTYPAQSKDPEIVGIADTGFGAGSLGFGAVSHGDQPALYTEYTTDLDISTNPDWCMEFKYYRRGLIERPSDRITLVSLLPTASNYGFDITGQGANDNTNGTGGSDKTVFGFQIISTSGGITDTETYLGAAGRYLYLNWYHIALIHKGGVHKLYVNGTLSATLTASQDSGVRSNRIKELFGPAIYPLHDAQRFTIGSTVYGFGSTITPPTGSL